MEMNMKLIVPAFALALLLANQAAATVFEVSEHDYTTKAHVEVLNGDHSASKKK
jgi:hypothetical protein